MAFLWKGFNHQNHFFKKWGILCINPFIYQYHTCQTATKTEDDADNSDFSKERKPSLDRNKFDDFSLDTLSNSLRPSSYTFEDDHDSEMTSVDGVSEQEINDISMNNLQSTTSSSNQNNNFARSFINNTRRRMSSGIVLSYNFLKSASSTRRDST